jgi:glycerol-3-phosphate acyltransferase PlsX
MSSIIKIAVDAMGGDNSPNKIIDGVVHHYSSNQSTFYKIFGDKDKILRLIKK